MNFIKKDIYSFIPRKFLEILVLLLIILSPNLVYAQDPSLIAHWPFDEGMNNIATDVTGNGNDGTLFGDPTWTTGVIGPSAISFDGSDDIVFISDPGLDWSLDITDAMTISVWIKPTSFTFAGQEKVVSKDNVYEFLIDSNNIGSYRIRLNNGTSGPDAPANTRLIPGIWQHIAFTWDGTAVQYYYSGLPDGGYQLDDTLRTNSANVGIAARPVNGNAQSPVHGSLDDVRIYNRALDASEIQGLFALGAGSDTAAPTRFNGVPSGFLPGGTEEVLISLTTDENAQCRYDSEDGLIYDEMTNVFDTTGGTTHSSLITGLLGGTTHTFFIKCQDGVGNTNATDFIISFSIRGTGGTGFHPTDLDPLMFYIESIFFNDFENKQRTIATCNTQECYSGRDQDPIDMQYCDTVLDANAKVGARGTAPYGCIRRWEDMSPYISGRADGTELIVGRDFGQDDAEKPIFVPNCINGHPCARGIHRDSEGVIKQNATFEIENGDAFEVGDELPGGIPKDQGLDKDFSIFQLVRPVEQSESWWYFGCANSRGLRHNIVDNSLFYRCGGAAGVPCENEGIITIPEAVELNQWQLIEVHRDINDDIQVIINGVDVSAETPLNAGGGWCYHDVMSRTKGQAEGLGTMLGDYAASAVYNRNLTLGERQDVRDYLDNVYDFLNDRPIIEPNDHEVERGYHARACGFDMDHDFIYGEPEDCNVGDGVTTDPDGDGVDEDILYVDCQNGSDDVGDGSAGNPYLTIENAFEQADGPGDGAEDIIAFTGICSPDEYTIKKSGIPGIKIRPKSGSEERDFQYPTNPIMLIGWDKDNDGQYPPFDQDDVSELNGGEPVCLATALKTGKGIPVSYLEMAHFTVRAYGNCAGFDVPSSFMLHQAPENQINSHHYFHDTSIIDVNRDTISGESGNLVHNLFSGGSYQWVAWENQEILNVSGFVYRGSTGTEMADSGPWRFQGTTITCFAPRATCTGWKNWRQISQVEIIDQIFDMNITPEWRPNVSLTYAFVAPSQCAQDWVIRNNEIRDVQSAFSVIGYDEGACNPEIGDISKARPTKDIVIEGNMWKNTFRWSNSPTGPAKGTCLIIAGCNSVESTVSNLQFNNNVCWSNEDMAQFISVNCLQDFDENPGSYSFINNTFYVNGDAGSSLLAYSSTDGGSFAENDVTFQNNIVVMDPGNIVFRFPFAIDSLVSDNNTFSPGLRFFWSGMNLSSKDEWYSLTGNDFNSFECTPTFVDPLNGDLHLDSNDACALNFGIDMSRDVATDIDWEGRPADMFWDIGADELSGPAAPDTTPPLRSNGAPSGSLPSGTTETSITLTTNEAATCKYSTTPGVDFDSMTMTLNMTGGLAHSTSITGLEDEESYIFYVRCEDGLGNQNTSDFQISFNVAGLVIDTTPPVRTNGQPTGALSSGTTNTDISLTTDEDAVCKYSTTPGTDFASMTSTFSTTGGTNHSSNVTGLSDGQAFNFYIRCQDVSANSNTNDFNIMFNVEDPADTTPPVRTNGAPTGTLPSGTTDTDLSLTTDEDATCKYSTTPGQTFASMTSTFSTTGGTSHSSNVTGLTDGQSLNYYVKCEDTSTNSNTTDFNIMFSVEDPVDTTPPVRTNGAPTGTLPAGTTQTNISLTTDEDATCKYSTTPGQTFASMTSTFSTTGGTSHSSNVTGLTDGQSLNYYVKCEDGSTNSNIDDFQIVFNINTPLDSTPPFRTNGMPTGTLPSGTTQTNISLTTDEDATCKYSTNPNIDFDSMTSTFSTTGGTSHSSNVTALSDGQTYNYYIKCQDGSANSNTNDFLITFSVSSLVDTTPPVRADGAPTGSLSSGTTQTPVSLTTNESAVCKYSTTPGVSFESMTSTFDTARGVDHLFLLTGLNDGQSYIYYVKCQDEIGNSNTNDFVISFSVNMIVDNIAPIRSNGLPSGTLPAGTTVADISLSTNENAICRYSTDSGIDFGSMTSTFSTTGETSHISNLAGLFDGQSYSYFVKCQDESANANTSDFLISFEVGEVTVPDPIMLQALLPSQAGVENVFMAINATPNGEVKFIYGFREQMVSADNICSGLQAGMLNPRTNLPQVTADSSGKAVLGVQVPSNVGGAMVLIQAVDLSSCTISNLNIETLSNPTNFTLHPMVPAQAGTQNSLTVTTATPNSAVKIIWGVTQQAVTADNICPGFQSGILNPRTLTRVRTNDSGHVTIYFNVPSNLAGMDFFIQAADLSTCTGSNVTSETL